MNRKLLASAICASLFVAGTASAQDTTSTSQSQDQSTTAPSGTPSPKKQEQDKKVTRLQAVTVTGSLIPQVQLETANPVITITGQDMEKNFSAAVKAMVAES